MEGGQGVGYTFKATRIWCLQLKLKNQLKLHMWNAHVFAADTKKLNGKESGSLSVPFTIYILPISMWSSRVESQPHQMRDADERDTCKLQEIGRGRWKVKELLPQGVLGSKQSGSLFSISERSLLLVSFDRFFFQKEKVFDRASLQNWS